MNGRKRAPLLALLSVAMLVAYLAVGPVCNPLAKGGPPTVSARSDPIDAVPGELLVKYRKPMVAAARRVVNGALGSKEVGRVSDLGVSRVVLKPGVSVEEAARRYGTLPDVEYAEPNVIVHADMVPNDPFYLGRQQWYYDEIGAPKAWDAETGKPYVIVGILDTGVDATHPDLKDNIWTNSGEVASNGVDDDGNGCADDVHGCNFAETSQSCPFAQASPNGNTDDDDGHGTFVAGIVAAKGNNSVGVTGTAPNVTIMPVKVLDCQGAGTASAAAQGILYAAKAGVRVINLSFGSPMESLTLRAAIDEAYDVYGVTIVAAAGNSGAEQVEFPARYSKVIAVSASDHKNADSKASFSNWGPEVTVTAPGVDIAGTVPMKLCGAHWSCFGGEPYAMGNGTSFSTALVSGAAALLVSSGRATSPDQVKDRLAKTALKLPNGTYDDWAGAGMVQIDQALGGKLYQIGVTGIAKN